MTGPARPVHVLPGTPDQRSGGERLSPSQVNRWGMAAPAANAGLETVMASGGLMWLP
jgi:hypothetical protein